MPDGDTSTPKASRAAADALLREQDWGRLYAQLLAFALKRAKTRAAAEDLVQEALRRVLDAQWEPWDPEKSPDLFKFLTGIVNRLLSNDRTSARAHREIAMDRDAMERTRERRAARSAEKVADGRPSPEAQLAAHELLARRMERLRTYVATDEVVCGILGAFESGHQTASDQAAAMEQPVERIYEGRRRLGKWVTRVAREIPGDDEEETQ